MSGFGTKESVDQFEVLSSGIPALAHGTLVIAIGEADNPPNGAYVVDDG